MQGFNHVAGGICFTGIFASFADINILSSPSYIAVTTICSVLPDVDHTRSLVGKSVYPLAKFLQKRFGHRTVTHSIFFFFACVLIAGVIQKIWGGPWTLIVSLSVGSHLIFDMCTRQGIPIFYPFSKRIAVLPANPKLRISAGDIRTEAIIFLVFLSLNIFMLPLYASGFWTQYNKSFSTFDHLAREMKRKPGLYSLDYVYERDTLQALVYLCDSKELVVFRGNKLEKLETEKAKLVEFKYSMSERKNRVYNLFSVSLDSVNSVLRSGICISFSVQSENELYYFDNTILKKGTELKGELVQPVFYETVQNNYETETRIKLLEIQKKEVQRKYNYELETLQLVQNEIQERERKSNLSSYEHDKNLVRLQELKTKLRDLREPFKQDLEAFDLQIELERLKLKKESKINAQIVVWK